jgi:glycosyltransferase involved in cell wall biosynthesis
MRIALLVPGGVDRGGEQRVIPALLWLIERLAARHDVQVIALRQEDQPGEWPLAGARIHNIGRTRTHLRALRTLTRLHRAAPFDLVQAFWAGSTGALAVLAGKAWRIPSAIHVAGGELAALPDIGYGGALTGWGRWRGKLMLRHASAVSAASEPMIESLAQFGIAATRIALGVDLRRWPPRVPAVRAPAAPARLLHVAGINRVKDQATLLRALRLVRQQGMPFSMDIVGEDHLGGSLQCMARELGLESCVRFRGFLTQQSLRPLFDSADLLVMSSRHESGPLVLLEAAVAGVPAVGTAVGHFTEWTPAAALAAPTGDAAALAACIREMLEDEPLRLRIAHQAQARALAQDADCTARLFEALYARLCGARA